MDQLSQVSIGAANTFTTFVTSAIVWYVLKLVMGLRVTKKSLKVPNISECGMECTQSLQQTRNLVLDGGLSHVPFLFLKDKFHQL
jgi:ammonia channel protein AmtB